MNEYKIYYNTNNKQIIYLGEVPSQQISVFEMFESAIAQIYEYNNNKIDSFVFL